MREDKSYRVILLPEAKDDLNEIEEYYLKEAGHLVSERNMRRIHKDLSIFEMSPWVGRPYRSKRRRMFFIFDGRYVVFYLVNERRCLVEIGAILRSESDWIREAQKRFRIIGN